MQRVCNLYQQAPVLLAQGVHVVCTDEKSGMQALERLHPSKTMRAKDPERREFEYTRHGTSCLIASREVATGRIIAPSLGPTRTNVDFLAHLAGVVATAPQAAWVFIADNLNIHCSADLVQWVALTCGLPDDLGATGKRGILKTMASRAAFLADPSHRIRVVHTPKHCSWLNQIELWFGTLVRALLRRGSFVSVQALVDAVLAFIHAYNETKAMPYRWTYTGQPACA